MATVSVLLAMAGSSMAFLPLSSVKHYAASSTIGGHNMIVDASIIDAQVVDSFSNVMQQSSTQVGEVVSSFQSSTNNLAFSDQGQNLAGIFFQASLLPYLAFLYFLSFRANRINNIGNFGFQFILLFVVSTIPAGIISKLTYGTSLANVDWLHGGAELLLTVANVLIVGFLRVFCVFLHYLLATHNFGFDVSRCLGSKRLQRTQILQKLT